MKQEEHLDNIIKNKLEGLNFEYNPAHWEMLQERMHIEGMDATDASTDAFDAALKGKLENIAPDFNPSHWERMQDAIALDGLTPIDADPIDEFIKSRLENITPELDPVHWEMMKDVMGEEGMQVDLDPVDELLKGKLENIEFAYNPLHWDALQTRIAQEEYADAKQVEDILFDASAYGHLSNVEVPYNEEHWKLMKERIDAEFSIRGRMVRYKVAEVALILMIIISAFHYLPIHQKNSKDNTIIANSSIINNTNTEKSVAKNKVTAKKEKFNSSENSLIASNSVESNDVTVADNSNTLIVDAVAENSSIDLNENTYQINQSLASNDLDNNSNVSDLTDGIFVGPPTSFLDEPIERIEQPTSNAVANAIAESILAKAENVLETGSSMLEAMTTVETVETLPTALLDIEKENDAVACSTCTELTQKWGFSVGMASAFELNYIMTPYDNVFNEGAYSQNAFGYGGGFSFGFRYNKWEVETGALYSFKQYAPKPQIEIFGGNLSSGYRGESINDVELNMVKIPLNLKYHFYQKGKWNVYANGGANLNMAMQANYDKKQYLFRASSPTIGFTPNPGTSVAVSETSAKKRFADGILEGGSFIENRYFTANLGFGVERKFNPRWSIFGQPTYQHQLLSQGLGPNKDRINTLSILTGARVTF